MELIENQPQKIKLLCFVNGLWKRYPAVLLLTKHRIEFLESTFELKDEIKAMQGSRWHGHDPNDGRKIWSIADTPRNRFQLAYLSGTNVYQWFEQPISVQEYERPLKHHQVEMSDHFLTYHFGIMAAEMGTGKTLTLQEIMERSGALDWWWVGPKASLPNIEREFLRWNLSPTLRVDMMSYEDLVKRHKAWEPGHPLPQGLVCDEASKLKNPSAQRSAAAQFFADQIRAIYGNSGYVILASGTPSPKQPADWWSLAEIAYPGFLREGSRKALEDRLSISMLQQFAAGNFKKHITWRDDERKCNVCGELVTGKFHQEGATGYHPFQPCTNEVALLHERLKGLVIVKHKKDVLDLPDKHYRIVECPPTASIQRVAKTILGTAVNTITGLTLLRELSDGFQYVEEPNGTGPCKHCPDHCGEVTEWYHPDHEDEGVGDLSLLGTVDTSQYVSRKVPCPACGGSGVIARTIRKAKEIPCPKDKALKDLLDENEEVGRLVIFAGFEGSIDRCVRLCLAKKWSVVRCDGRGYTVFDANGKELLGEKALDYWADTDHNELVAFVAHPESGGMGLTLTEARMSVYWSNSYKPEYRTQSEDRIHRIGMDVIKGCTIVDLIHLPTDLKVLETIRANRKLELMTLGDFEQCFALAA